MGEHLSGSWCVGDAVAARFRLVGPPIGGGASGVVYPAEDRDGTPVAVKRLHAAVHEDPERFARLQAEIARAGALEHPHILGVVGLVAHGGDTALVTERLDGGSVRELGHPLTHAAVVALGIQVARALAAAHRVGIVHGDVRPGNVLLGQRGAALFDFGISQAGTVAELRPGQTPPEVLDGAPPGVRADLYGVGLIMYRASRGYAAFGGPTAWARIGRQRAGSVDMRGLSVGLATCLRLLLHPDPLRRPLSAVALIRMLREVQRRPHRAARRRRRFLAPFRPFKGWAVHGVDPATGAAAMLRTDLSRAQARRLERRLDGEGWSVRAERVALTKRDLLLALMVAVMGWFVIPIVGSPLLGVAVLKWRSSQTRHELPVALPAVRAPLPPRRLPPGGEQAVTAGLLMMLSGVLLAWWPAAALVPLAFVGWLAVDAARAAAVGPGRRARDARIEGALALARRNLEHHARELPLDVMLGRLGAIDALEEAWRSERCSDDEILRQLEAQPGPPLLSGPAPRSSTS